MKLGMWVKDVRDDARQGMIANMSQRMVWLRQQDGTLIVVGRRHVKRTWRPIEMRIKCPNYQWRQFLSRRTKRASAITEASAEANAGQ